MIFSRYLVPAVFGAALAGSATALPIYDHTFDEGTGQLDGTTVDGGTAQWVANSSYNANGVTSGSNSALLPYDFGSSVYEVTGSFTVAGGLTAIYFTTSDPLDPGYVIGGSEQPYGTFALRSNGDFEMWGGVNTNAGNDGGNLTDYGFSSGDGAAGTLRMVLDTTQANWTIAGYYTPEGGSEQQIDVNQSDPNSLVYTYGNNQPAGSFTGTGVMNGNPADFSSFTLSELTGDPVPEPASAGLFALGGLLICGRRRRSK